MQWTWSPEKAVANARDHHLSFETAIHVFDDPLHLSRLDVHPDGDRWQTVGRIGPAVVLVVHTWPAEEEVGDEPVGRIISARKATMRERKVYEEEQW